jgi:hypothetical protein
MEGFSEITPYRTDMSDFGGFEGVVVGRGDETFLQDSSFR